MAQKKYTPEQEAEAFDKYADGKSLKQVSGITGIPFKTLQAWYERKHPGDWALHRKKRVTSRVEILEKESLESYRKTTARQQKLLRDVALRLAKRAVDATDDEIKAMDAVKELPKIIDKERELHIEPDEVLKIKNKSTVMGVGASVEGKDGVRSSAIAFLRDASREIYGTGSSDPENTEGE